MSHVVSPREAATPIRVALLGAGTVGSQTARLLVEQAQDLSARIGRPMQLVGVSVLDPDEVTVPWIDKSLLTTNSEELVTRADIVIELIGGIEPARTLLLKALNSGASVVTANKALLATHGPELYKAAAENGVDIYFEAAVGGAIPIVRPLRESLVGDRVNRVMGIVNGTTNYILDEMTLKGITFDEALKDAQAKGFAEADPTADIEGFDAAAKAAIIACLSFHTDVRMDDVRTEGISHVTASDIAAAKALNRVIKLLAVVTRTEKGITAGVYPAMIPLNHPLAAVHGSFNAVFVEAEAAGDLMFYGQGAGGAPTASAVVGDVVSEARHLSHGSLGPDIPLYANLPILEGDEDESSFVMRVLVLDAPGVLAKVSQTFANHGISIKAVTQLQLKDKDGYNELWITTHVVSEKSVHETAKDLDNLVPIQSVLSIMRIFED
ncbi:MAG: homoserine dehydrogenase [Bifidobacteriaceae bacterium]|jgi:homoserine dehydrogenase|nr:homoserine dehydrogenase [Bifidobacteriaceae bacterium]MCI1979393.1 homoserine dehydrogenase [Bifidobacteriaceae bacterium]